MSAFVCFGDPLKILENEAVFYIPIRLTSKLKFLNFVYRFMASLIIIDTKNFGKSKKIANNSKSINFNPYNTYIRKK